MSKGYYDDDEMPEGWQNFPDDEPFTAEQQNRMTKGKDMRTIDLRTALEELQKLADANPTRTEECTLATSFRDDNDRVSWRAVCIVGHAYADWGIPLSTLYHMENVVGAERLVDRLDDEFDDDDWSDPKFGERFGLQFTVAAIAVLALAQTLQDNGVKWGPAVAEAKDRAIAAWGPDLIDDGEIYRHGSQRVSWPVGELLPTTAPRSTF